ncbi:Choline-sulfatase [Allorhodopirellula heiligendammensis]|uniref:Choline-sulfatase n=2 Tax=Allorhodopirellula heiligendammensis TaxID=2714739 RepID=A0A5C6BXK4_9BACT|nr:Choline-sulfatase [Allorhodopirellula heiligendammensis]
MPTRTIALIFCLLPATTLTVSAQQEAVQPIPQPQKVSSQPNIVMIAIDDLNDWVEPLAGHPQVQTPAIAQLAQRGVTFTNAHCQAPLCNPSRTSIMTGLRPESTGVYGLAPWFRTLPEFEDRVTLQQYFQRHGYRTLIGGKIFHGPYGRGKNSSDECDTWGPNASVGVTPKQKRIPPTPGGNHALMDWGTFPHRDEDKGDWKVASWAVKELEKMPADKPFFLSVGFFLPHVPCYATQKWFDLYPEHELQLPPIVSGDRDDTPLASWYIHWNLPEPRTKWLLENNQLKPLVRAYLASISFVDSQVGRVLDALEASPYADNTIVVLWSDHGYHLGEKAISGKNSLWTRSTRVPLIIAGPRIEGNRKCNQPAELLDIYPTLASLAGLPQPAGVEGMALTPQLNDVSTPRERPAICTHNAGNHSVCDLRWRYIVYADGSEELYDRAEDPNEFNNLLSGETHGPDLREVVERLRKWLPEQDRPLAVGSAHRILEQRPDGFYWEGQRIDPASPPLDDQLIR